MDSRSNFEGNSIQVAALYKFVELPDFANLQSPILDCADRNGVRGSILLANEGINGTVAGTPEGMEAFLGFLRSLPPFSDLEVKFSYCGKIPFRRMKVRLKKEIVTLGVDSVNPREQVGNYVEPEDWNALISDPDTILIDTRNQYETEIGLFEGAIDPGTEDFREFPDFVDRHLDPEKTPKVAMYCTGGIRCEKATNLLLNRGFKDVYHLKGGILKYLEKVPQEKSKWQGECFVFDQRVSVDHQLKPGQYILCDGCDRPLTPEDRQSPLYREGVHCHHCHHQLPEEKRQRLEERRRQRQRGEL